MKNTDIIKDKLNILDVVSSYVKLEKAGKTYKGKSPFTNEKTPSFFVSPEKGFFYCFSSGKGGDMFTFVQDIERVEFKDALVILAEKAGVDLGTFSVEDQSQEQLRYKILDDITKWYEVHLRKNSDVVNYLLGRGLTKDTIIEFRVGFALDDWRDCYNYLKSRKYADADVEAVGMIIKKEGSGHYDRFRSRVMFPLFDSRGRVVGFSGRIFTDDPEQQGAKYINSPEGPLFDKSKVLYGYHTAKTAMAKAGSCILVEGQLDVLMAQQAGYVNTVAISGTGLTDDHITMIKRFTDTILLALDSDKAGIKATRRSVLAAYRHGMSVNIISMPEGMDPADTIAHSKEQWDVCVSDAKDYVDYRLEMVNKQNPSFEEKQTLVTKDLFPFVYHMQSAVIQDRILQKLSLFLGVSVDSVRNDFKNFKPDSDDAIEYTTQLKTQDQSSKIMSSHDETLYFYAYLKDKGLLENFSDMKKITDLYKQVYDSDLDADHDSIDETLKNMQLFILEERYKDSSEASFERLLLTAIVEERVRQMGTESMKLLETIRLMESKGEIEEFKKSLQEHQALLLEKTTLMDSIHTN
ncbi:MAG: DNA primase [Candidatus Paceibacteria bacterium]|jgi:DNA primase